MTSISRESLPATSSCRVTWRHCQIEGWKARWRPRPRFRRLRDLKSRRSGYPRRGGRTSQTSDVAAELHRSFGVDLTRIDGIKIMTGQVILSELGPDLSRSEEHTSELQSLRHLV